MKNKIRWGIIGAGGIARRRTIPEGFMQAKHSELVVVSNKEVADEFCVKSAENIEDLLQNDIEAVYVASPVFKHMDHVISCAKAKKHVLCEKPLGLTVEEAEKMTKTCNAEGVILGTGLMLRFLAQHQTALKFIQEGKLGKVVFGRAQLSCWYPPIEGAWRQKPQTGGGGALMDMGSHCIDLMDMFFGDIRSVSCYINNNVHYYESEDSAVVSICYKNGALATVDTYFCIPDNSIMNVLELYGSKGSILAKGTLGQNNSGEMIAYFENEIAEYNPRQARDGTNGLVINPIPVNPYLAEIEEFSRAIIENRIPLNNRELGLHNQKVLAACYESANTGKVVFLD